MLRKELDSFVQGIFVYFMACIGLDDLLELVFRAGLRVCGFGLFSH